jgi:tRNA1(Val) A37 N6-methylase TrmN6
MLGKAPTDRGNNTDLITNNIHLPSTYPSEASTEMTIQQAVDTIIQDINPFHWELEFPTVFAKGGFDCVVGNPPYVSAINMNSNDREFL